MGYTSYSSGDRMMRAASTGYFTKKTDDIFEQNKKHEIHESMDPKNAKLREARDSEIHPVTAPIILALDVTGSMGKIPHYLVKDGLPHTISSIIERGVPSPALLFLAIGDTKCDRYPLQVGQFESGDAELDTWLTRSYLESGGGGNGGESYLTAWYYAAFHTVTDAWEKRKQKGFLFTTGDEPCHAELPRNVISELMGISSEKGYTSEELLKAAQEKWNVYHLHISHVGYNNDAVKGWKELIGENCIVVENYHDISKIISDIVVCNTAIITKKEETKPDQSTDVDKKDEEIIL